MDEPDEHGCSFFSLRSTLEYIDTCQNNADGSSIERKYPVLAQYAPVSPREETDNATIYPISNLLTLNFSNFLPMSLISAMCVANIRQYADRIHLLVGTFRSHSSISLLRTYVLSIHYFREYSALPAGSGAL